MQIMVSYSFMESYLPSKRHKILRWRESGGELSVTINEVSETDAPVAFLVTELRDELTKYYWFDNQLWRPVLWSEMHGGKTGLFPISQLVSHIKSYTRFKHKKTEQEAISEIREESERFIIIDGVVCRKIGEPRYVLMTFGLGNNHGGTSLMIDNHYNSNISKDRYYNALDKEKAIADAKAVAIKRGDTNHVDRIGESWIIKVLMPEAVRCKPQEEHGDGDPFLNSLYALTANTSSTTEATLLAVALTASETSAMK